MRLVYVQPPDGPDLQELLRAYCQNPSQAQFKALSDQIRPHLEATLAAFSNDWPSILRACDSALDPSRELFAAGRFNPRVDYETYLIALALFCLSEAQCVSLARHPVTAVLRQALGPDLPLRDLSVLTFAAIWRLEPRCTTALVLWLLWQPKVAFYQWLSPHRAAGADESVCVERLKESLRQLERPAPDVS